MNHCGDEIDFFGQELDTEELLDGTHD